MKRFFVLCSSFAFLLIVTVVFANWSSEQKCRVNSEVILQEQECARSFFVHNMERLFSQCCIERINLKKTNKYFLLNPDKRKYCDVTAEIIPDYG